VSQLIRTNTRTLWLL